MIVLTRFRHTLRFIGAYAAANIQAAMEYRISFWVQVFTMVANDSLWLFFWWTYFQQFPVVHGWQNSDIVVIWAVAACAFGISAGFFGNASRLATLIMNGGLDAYLGMPRNVLLHVCISASDPTAWGDIIFASRPAALRPFSLVNYGWIADIHLVLCDYLLPGLLPGQYRGTGAAVGGSADYIQYLSHVHF